MRPENVTQKNVCNIQCAATGQVDAWDSNTTYSASPLICALLLATLPLFPVFELALINSVEPGTSNG